MPSVKILERWLPMHTSMRPVKKRIVNDQTQKEHVAMMAQMQNTFDFPPAPKLGVYGRKCL